MTLELKEKLKEYEAQSASQNTGLKFELLADENFEKNYLFMGKIGLVQRKLLYISISNSTVKKLKSPAYVPIFKEYSSLSR
ncbi:hypothetical protein HK099_006502, partial [Clydaea vesicula]